MKNVIAKEINEIIIHPRNNEVDVFQIVHHSFFISWIEEANFNFLKNVVGISRGILRETAMFKAINNLEFQYKDPVTDKDALRITTHLEYDDFTSFRMKNIVCSATSSDTIFAKARVQFNLKNKVLQSGSFTPDIFAEKLTHALKVRPEYFSRTVKIGEKQGFQKDSTAIHW